MTRANDDRLLARIASGDHSALAALYDSHARLLAFRLRRDGASREETEDVLQETFLDVWRAAEAYRGESEVGGWLWGIASRKYRMLIRGEIRLRRRQDETQTTRSSVGGDEGWALSIDAEDAIHRLNPELREVFKAVAVEGLSIAEAAEVLGVPVGTVKSRLHRARIALRRELR